MATYHLTLDGQGYLIDEASYRKAVASPFAPKQRQGDAGYGDLARASVWALTDWRGGMGYNTFDPDRPDRYDSGPGIDSSQGDLRLGRALMVVDQGRLHVAIADTTGLGIYVYDGHGWSCPSTGGLGQEPRGIASFNGALILGNKSASGARIYKTATTTPTSAQLITGSFDAGLAAIDKLFVSVRLQHSALASGESIQVEYSLDGAGSWTSLGTSDVDGATGATFTFAPGVTGKRIRFRVTLTVTSTSATPALQVLLLNYLVAPDVKAQWTFDVLLEGTAELPLVLLDHSAEAKTGAQLSAALWASKAKKSTLSYTDLDGTTKTVYLVDLEERVAPRSQRQGYSTRARVRLEEA